MLIIHRWMFNLLILYIFLMNIFYFLSLVLLCAQFSVAKVSDINNHVSKVGFGNWIVAPPPRLKQRKPTWGCPGRGGGAFSQPPIPKQWIGLFIHTHTRSSQFTGVSNTALSGGVRNLSPLSRQERKSVMDLFFSIWSSDLINVI